MEQPLHVWGRFLVPNTLTVQHALRQIDQKSRELLNQPLRWSVPIAKDREDPVREDTFPGGVRPTLCALHGLAPLLDPGFRSLFLQGSTSVSCPAPDIGRKMSHTQDPDQNITLYSVSPFVILADRTRLGALPLPRRWYDLMDPVYQGQIVTTGKRTPDSVPYFYFYQLFGKDGMEAFGQNVVGGTSPARMAMEAGSRASMGGLYILPWFFARCCPRREATCLIWPEEGALAYPLLLLAHPNLPAPAQLVADYWMGEVFARESGRMCLPTAHHASEAFLPPSASICCFDWGALRAMDLEAYRAAVGDFSHTPSLGEKTDWGKPNHGA